MTKLERFAAQFATDSIHLSNQQKGLLINFIVRQISNGGYVTQNDCTTMFGSSFPVWWPKMELVENNRGYCLPAYLETKRKKPQTKNNVQDGEIELLLGPGFVEVWNLWRQYKQNEFGFKYKSDISEKTALNSIYQMSNGNPLTAAKIIEQSIKNGWSGLFELKTDSSNDKTIDDIKNDVIHAVNAMFE